MAVSTALALNGEVLGSLAAARRVDKAGDEMDLRRLVRCSAAAETAGVRVLRRLIAFKRSSSVAVDAVGVLPCDFCSGAMFSLCTSNGS